MQQPNALSSYSKLSPEQRRMINRRVKHGPKMTRQQSATYLQKLLRQIASTPLR
jgi:hypothetical protein